MFIYAVFLVVLLINIYKRTLLIVYLNFRSQVFFTHLKIIGCFMRCRFVQCIRKNRIVMSAMLIPKSVFFFFSKTSNSRLFLSISSLAEHQKHQLGIKKNKKKIFPSFLSSPVTQCIAPFSKHPSTKSTSPPFPISRGTPPFFPSSCGVGWCQRGPFGGHSGDPKHTYTHTASFFA